MTDETKQNIDDMHYQSMLQLWRFAKSGHPYFIGETGIYFTDSMKAKRKLITDAQYTAVSKRIGW